MSKAMILFSLILLASCANVPQNGKQLTDTERAAAPSKAQARGNDVIGTWIDKIPGLSGRITICREADGAVTYELAHVNGSRTHLKLREVETGRRFRVIDCSHGDNFRIKSNGDLEIWDREGFIRSVKRAR